LSYRELEFAREKTMKMRQILELWEHPDSPRKRYPVGYRFIRNGNKRKDIETIVDIYITRNEKNEVVGVVYVTEHDFNGQSIRDYNVLSATIARSQEVK
jgi:hypothetical protein